jgi:hypothetical protein
VVGAPPPLQDRGRGSPARPRYAIAEPTALLAQGRSNREIADALSLSVRTVDRHADNLYRKLDMRGRGEAAAFAARHGLLPG